MKEDSSTREIINQIRPLLKKNPFIDTALSAVYNPISDIRYAHSLKTKYQSIRNFEKKVRDWEEHHPPTGHPVILMNTSSRISDISFNAGAELVIGWALRIAGHRVVYYSCKGLPQCQLGTRWQKPQQEPQCRRCTALSGFLRPADATVTWNRWPDEYDRDLIDWYDTLCRKSTEELIDTTFEDIPVGKLTWNSLSWSFRLGNPSVDINSAKIYAKYIIGASQLARHCNNFLEKENPLAVVVFNGVSYPEAVVSHLARNKGIHVVTYESGYNEGSIFFSHEQATKYELQIPPEFSLGNKENTLLDDYLLKRFKGNFTMAGNQFWPEIHEIEEKLSKIIDQYDQVATIFTNVVFDTSQIYANEFFPDMFDWLESTMNIAKNHPETLFIVRSHPDENRPGKASREPVMAWLRENGWLSLNNVICIGPEDYTSSYQLIQKSKFILIYNSTIGLEAVLLGKPVIAGGMPCYYNSGAVIIPDSRNNYFELVKSAITSNERLNISDYQEKARKYYYFRIFNSCLQLSKILGNGKTVDELKINNISGLMHKEFPEIGTLIDGIVEGKPFIFNKNSEVIQ